MNEIIIALPRQQEADRLLNQDGERPKWRCREILPGDPGSGKLSGAAALAFIYAVFQADIRGNFYTRAAVSSGAGWVPCG